MEPCGGGGLDTNPWDLKRLAILQSSHRANCSIDGAKATRSLRIRTSSKSRQGQPGDSNTSKNVTQKITIGFESLGFETSLQLVESLGNENLPPACSCKGSSALAPLSRFLRSNSMQAQLCPRCKRRCQTFSVLHEMFTAIAAVAAAPFQRSSDVICQVASLPVRTAIERSSFKPVITGLELTKEAESSKSQTFTYSRSILD